CFFQAEDGIRDRNVTGVQTCALPIFNNRHKATGEDFEDAVATMTTLNAEAARAAVAAGIRAATDVTGFGLLGHLFKMARASGVGAVIDAAAVPRLDGVDESIAA